MKRMSAIRIAFALILVVTLHSCASPRKVDKWVSRHYSETVPAKIKTNDYITFNIEGALPAEKVSETKKSNGQFIPALVFWKWKHETTSQLNARLSIASFTNHFTAHANAKKLKEKLKGASLEVTIKSNPADFRLHEDGWLAFILVYYISNEKIYVEPVNSNVSVDYKITQVSGETKNGNISIANPIIEKDRRMFQSVKGAVTEYLDISDTHLKSMSKDLVDKLILDISSVM